MDKREQFIQALRVAAIFYEANPEVPIPFNVNFGWWGYGDEGKDGVLAFAKAVPFAAKKYQETDFWLDWAVTPKSVTMRYGCQREAVCERVVVGTKIVPAEPEKVIPAEPEHEEEIVEWICKPLLAEEVSQ